MDVNPNDVPTALMHLYRGEVGRMVNYRTRLDTTTNWAVGTTAAMISFALGQERVPHFVMLLALSFDLAFLWMEARRFRFYEMVRMRVRLLETGFYAELLGGDARPRWEEALRASLTSPTPPLTHLQAAAVRLRRSYLWLLGAVFLGWLLKLYLAPGTVLQAAAAGPVPGPVVFAGAGLLLVVLLAISRAYVIAEEE